MRAGAVGRAQCFATCNDQQQELLEKGNGAPAQAIPFSRCLMADLLMQREAMDVCCGCRDRSRSFAGGAGVGHGCLLVMEYMRNGNLWDNLQHDARNDLQWYSRQGCSCLEIDA